MRDALGPIYTNPDFTDLFPKDGSPAKAPAQLALIAILLGLLCGVKALAG